MHFLSYVNIIKQFYTKEVSCLTNHAFLGYVICFVHSNGKSAYKFCEYEFSPVPVPIVLEYNLYIGDDI